jgi:hypothetical protein
MTATLTFDLNDHDERQAHMRCVKATDLALAIWSIKNQNLGNTRKQILQSIDRIMDEYNINLDDLIS